LTTAAGAKTLAPMLPPLLSERSPAVRLALMVLLPALGGFATGTTLGIGIGAWVAANVLATLGGVGGGLEHEDRAGAAKRGALGGAIFGLSLVLADALVVDHRVAAIADPPILQAVITTTIGTLLAVAGAALRARIVRRQTAFAA
jgi:hypothetical protein